MGLCFQTIDFTKSVNRCLAPCAHCSGHKKRLGLCFKPTPVEVIRMTYNLSSGWAWVVIRRETEPNPQGVNEWHLQGIAADESIAIEMCLDETYMIGPLPVNSTLPHDKIEWIGSYFPLRGQ